MIIFEFEDGPDIEVSVPQDLAILMPTAYQWSDGGGGIVTVRDSEDGRIITELYAGSGQLDLDWRALRGAILDEIQSYYGDDPEWYPV